ncbi:hypothetical protein MF672_039080 [Actinomadura sp. ATCC 31491]|uniref:Uncharacterized protein n=1 Tax=Actinomadura luzonensis TaxID=2805427 RepID=A0ABT0G572_9ACTN|nr:hypothetical protein [Actinomadura luzonensis]MCK2219759.1 hypothetical protein [Actinomadura luzonensis]
MNPTDMPRDTAVAISRETLEEFDLHRVGDMTRPTMAYWLGQLSAAVRALLAHAEPVEDQVPDEVSRYGAELDRLADRWRVLEDQHDLIHPNRSDCGGVGGCPMMFAAHDLTSQMKDQMEDWRGALAISEGTRHCGCDHHGDHAGCDADCECAR